MVSAMAAVLYDLLPQADRESAARRTIAVTSAHMRLVFHFFITPSSYLYSFMVP